MKESKVISSIRVPKDLLDQLQVLADNNPRVNSRNDLIKSILFDYVEAKNNG